MKIRAQIIVVLGFLGILFVTLPLDGFAQQQPKRDARKAKQALEQANRLYRQKNFPAAIESYSTAISFDPINAEAFYWRGNAHQSIKQFEEAVTDLTKSLELGYKALEVYRIRSYVNFDRKDFQAAVADAREVINAEPNNVQAIRLSAEASYELKNYDDALASYERLVTMTPADGNMYFLMARIYAGKGDVQKQIAAAHNAIQRGTSFLADAHILAAEGQVKLGSLQEAEASYLKALASRPEMPDIYRILGEMYRSQSRFNDAIDITRKALRIWTNDGDFYSDISWYYSLAGRHEDAIQAAQAGIRYKPNQNLAYTNLCRAYNDVEKYELAMSACNSALRYKPEDGETYFYLARANDGLNRSAEATRLYKKAVTGLIEFTKLRPDYSDGFYLLGNAYFADSQAANAITAYKRSLELNPRFARARYNLALVYIDGKEKVAAVEQHRLLAGLNPELAAKLKPEIDKLP